MIAPPQVHLGHAKILRLIMMQVVSDVPVLLLRSCTHIGVVNSAGLRVAVRFKSGGCANSPDRGVWPQGITNETPNPEGGMIDKNDRGEPTGIVREYALESVRRLIKGKWHAELGCLQLVNSVSPLPFSINADDHETLKKYLETALNYCLSVGLTTVQTNDDAPAWQCA